MWLPTFQRNTSSPLQLRRLRRYDPLKHWYPPTELHDVITWMTAVDIFTTESTSNLMSAPIATCTEFAVTSNTGSLAAIDQYRPSVECWLAGKNKSTGKEFIYQWNILIPCCRVLLVNMTVPQLAMKFSALLFNPNVHYFSKKGCYWNPSRTRWIQPTPSNPVYLRLNFNSIPPSMSRISKRLLLLNFQKYNFICIYLFQHACYMSRPSRLKRTTSSLILSNSLYLIIISLYLTDLLIIRLF
jgi:hypothetical protein